APAVLILHGSHGLGDGSLFYPQAKALADRGISAFVVHYFDGLGAARKAAPSLHDEREKVIADAISYVSRLGYVDAEKIGVFGLSLGGFHALSLGSRDQRVQAVVNMFGAMPAEVQRRGVDRMPPTLVLHGDRDRIVPVRKAHELASLLKDVGAEYEVKIYNGEGHAFRGAAKEDSISRTTDFFERHLGNDRGLLDKPIELDIALAPMVPDTDTLPIRSFTLGDEASLGNLALASLNLGNLASEQQVLARATAADDADDTLRELTPEEIKAEAAMLDLPPMAEDVPIN
ncbi:alpha/beta fold hydrolase, partial [Ferrovibrio sp.]|uniref:dienelactone hydrolase family protein n=1 Tax=Ferrovibrio sp. TaxID=1917215 RepID=UPI001B3D0DFA